MKDTISKFLAATMGLGLLVLAASQVRAQPQNCAPRDVVLEKLTEEFSETRRAIGLGTENVVVEIFAATSGSWSIIVTFPNGTTCLVAAGEAFEMIAAPHPARGDKV